MLCFVDIIMLQQLLPTVKSSKLNEMCDYCNFF